MLTGQIARSQEIDIAFQRLVDSLQILALLLPQADLQPPAGSINAVVAAAKRAIDDVAHLRACFELERS
jgi:hypothetical protein